MDTRVITTPDQVLEAAEDLRKLKHSILITPDATPAGSGDIAEAKAALVGLPLGMGLVETFDHGAIILLTEGSVGLDHYVVALAMESEILAGIATANMGEADALYAGLAHALGVLGRTCPCGNAVPSVYEVCITCA